MRTRSSSSPPPVPSPWPAGARRAEVSGAGPGAVPVLEQLRRGVAVERRVADLPVPVAVWQRLLAAAAVAAGVEVVSYLVPAVALPGRTGEQLVIVELIGATRVDPPAGARRARSRTRPATRTARG